jgi:hypothetical protein
MLGPASNISRYTQNPIYITAFINIHTVLYISRILNHYITGKLHRLQPNVDAKWLSLLSLILEVPDSNSGTETCLPN